MRRFNRWAMTLALRAAAELKKGTSLIIPETENVGIVDVVHFQI
jgi:hypothetical protein